MKEEIDPKILYRWNLLWSSCDFLPDEQEEVSCAYCDLSLGEYREAGIESVEIYWIDKDSLLLLDIPRWQKDVFLVPEDIYLCGRCGKPLKDLGWAFFLDSQPPLAVRLDWQRTALRLLATKLLRVRQHAEYLENSGFHSPRYEKDTRSPQPGSLAMDAWQ